TRLTEGSSSDLPRSFSDGVTLLRQQSQQCFRRFAGGALLQMQDVLGPASEAFAFVGMRKQFEYHRSERPGSDHAQRIGPLKDRDNVAKVLSMRADQNRHSEECRLQNV